MNRDENEYACFDEDDWDKVCIEIANRISLSSGVNAESVSYIDCEIDWAALCQDEE